MGRAARAEALTGSSFDATDGVLDSFGPPAQATDLPSGTGDDSYTQGAKEADLCPAVEFGSIPPNKDDLIHFWVSSQRTPSAYFLYLAWSRTNVLGTATIDFELNQSKGPAANCNGVNPARTAGDLLVTYDFQGGATVGVQVRTWSGSAWGLPVSLVSPTAEGSISADQLFGELAINLTAAGIFPPGVCRNFASAFAKSRASSSSFVNELKDFIAPIPIDVSNCGDVTVHKQDDAGAPLAGAVFTLYNDLTGTIGSAVTPTKSCTTDAAGDCTITNVFFGTYWVVETTTPPGHTTAPPQQVTVAVAGNTPPGALTFVDPRLPGEIDVHKQDGDSTALAGAQFTLYTDTGTGPGVVVNPPAPCTTDAVGNCSLTPVISGTYWLVETVTPTGFSTVPPQKVTVGLAQTVPVTLVDPLLPVTSTITTSTITLTVDKTNDANGDGTFGDSEIAPAAGAAVVFRAVITNTSSVAVVLDSLTDEWPGHAAFSLGADCPSLLGTTLDAGHSVTCLFTVAGYAPPAGSSRVDTVIAGVHEATNPANTASAQDTSTVSTRSAGGNPPSPPPPVLSISVEKTNDANGDGTFTDSETATAPGATVTFKAVISNTSAVDVVITALTDVFPGQSLATVCPELIGTTIKAGGSVTCTFILTGYAPPGGSSLTDTVQATVAQVGNPSNQTSAEDTSTVSTPPAAVLGISIPAPAPPAPAPAAVRSPAPAVVSQQLARTGFDLFGTLAAAAVLLLAGLALAGGSRVRRVEADGAGRLRPEPRGRGPDAGRHRRGGQPRGPGP